MIPLLLAVILPGLYWEKGPETAPELKRAGIERLYVPAAQAGVWRHGGLPVTLLDEAALNQLASLRSPGVEWRANVASATRLPWINANGWRFLRKPGGHFFSELRPRAAALAAAEAFAYDADAVLKIDPADLEAFGTMLRFLQTLDAPPLPTLANIGIVDDGSPLVGEVLNMLARRNLLFRVVPAPERGLLNVRVGTSDYPRDAARNPAQFAQKVRQQLGDEQRLLRIYGADTVLGRLAGDAARARLHLINYSGRTVTGMRVRVRGGWRDATLHAISVDGAPLADIARGPDAIEFTVPQMGVYAVVDLAK